MKVVLTWDSVALNDVTTLEQRKNKFIWELFWGLFLNHRELIKIKFKLIKRTLQIVERIFSETFPLKDDHIDQTFQNLINEIGENLKSYQNKNMETE